MCIFIVQIVVCGNITGSLSVPITVNISFIHPSKSVFISSSATACIASISSLATALIISMVVSTTVIVIILMRSKAKIKTASDQQLISRAERTEPMYEDVTGPQLSLSAINTQDNVAYGHTQI